MFGSRMVLISGGMITRENSVEASESVARVYSIERAHQRREVMLSTIHSVWHCHLHRRHYCSFGPY